MNSRELREAYVEAYPVDPPRKPSNSFERVREFMEAFGHPVYEKPATIKDHAWEQMRLRLIVEEVAELLAACGYITASTRIDFTELVKEGETDLVEAADALGDLEYVTNGAAHGMGINLPVVVKEVHRSNMTKLGPDGKPIYRDDGKILKGENYEKPDLRKVLGL